MLLFIDPAFYQINILPVCFNTSHVTLYRYFRTVQISQTHVSIHLMLLFIGFRRNGRYPENGFQYISCYSLSHWRRRYTATKNCFNTSHVTLYHDLDHIKETVDESFNTSHVTLYRANTIFIVVIVAVFQYISCYSLSMTRYRMLWMFHRFNTSHVTLYLESSINRSVILHVSIHLMLLFITCSVVCMCMIWWFQYISCYSLSFHKDRRGVFDRMFQYISCYSLSLQAEYYIRTETEFQYISCYSLSAGCNGYNGGCCVSIHLMLLFIYIPAILGVLGVRFNTSHVTLYQETGSLKEDTIGFQYISCYSLSQKALKQQYQKKCFNTSHVTLYRFDTLR